MYNQTSAFHRHGIIAALAVGVLLISGCAGGPASDEPAAAPPSTAPSAATETAAPTPAAPALAELNLAELNLDDPRSWLIDYTAIGPLALQGQLADQATSMTAFTSTVQEGCPWETAFDRTDFPSIWIPDPSDTGVVEQIVLQAWGSAPTVAASSPQTSAGIGIGATLDQIEAAYPDIQQNEGRYAPFYSLPDGSGHWINFGLSTDGLVDTIVVRDSALIDSEYCG